MLIYPGTELILLNGIVNVLIRLGSYDRDAEKTEGFDRLKHVVEPYSIDFVREACGVELEQSNELIEYIAESKALGIIHGMGLTQHISGSENVHTLLNLMILKNF